MSTKTKEQTKHEEVNEALASQLPATVVGGALPAVLPQDDYGEDVGVGVEDAGADEFLIPFLAVLQSNSPECDEADPAKYRKDARPGMIINKATGDLYDGKVGFPFIPAYREHHFVEFVPRNSGGGFVGLWQEDDPRIKPLQHAQGKFGKLVLASGNELTETFNLYDVIIKPDGTPSRVVVAHASTQIKVYRGFMTRVSELVLPGNSPRPFPLFAHRWRLRTVPMKNKKGSFYGWTYTLDGESPQAARLRPSDPLYVMAREFNKQLFEGAATADMTQQAEEVEGQASDEEMPF